MRIYVKMHWSALSERKSGQLECGLVHRAALREVRSAAMLQLKNMNVSWTALIKCKIRAAATQQNWITAGHNMRKKERNINETKRIKHTELLLVKKEEATFVFLFYVGKAFSEQYKHISIARTKQTICWYK